MIGTIRYKMWRIRKLFSHLLAIDAVRVIIWTVLRRRRPLKVRVGGTDLLVRTGTPDLNIAFSSLLNGEYSDIEILDARIIIDGGANIGTSSIAFALRYPKAVVIAIEPEAENFSILTENVKTFKNIKPLRAALAASSGKRPLFNRGTGPWGYTITDSSETVGEMGQTIDCVSIDEILDQYGVETVDILKLDIEGGEKELFEDCQSWIDSVRVVVAELHDRFVPGCRDAFDGATQSFEHISVSGEKLVAFR